MSNVCWKCGHDNFWFCRTTEAPCWSMHWVCHNCEHTQPCGADECLYGKEREPMDEPAKDARIAALEAEVKQLKKEKLSVARGQYEKCKALVELATKDTKKLLAESYKENAALEAELTKLRRRPDAKGRE